jgi:hypothetical protein
MDVRLFEACAWAERNLCTACLTPAEFKRFLAGDRQPSRGRDPKGRRLKV